MLQPRGSASLFHAPEPKARPMHDVQCSCAKGRKSAKSAVKLRAGRLSQERNWCSTGKQRQWRRGLFATLRIDSPGSVGDTATHGAVSRKIACSTEIVRYHSVQLAHAVQGVRSNLLVPLAPFPIKESSRGLAVCREPPPMPHSTTAVVTRSHATFVGLSVDVRIVLGSGEI